VFPSLSAVGDPCWNWSGFKPSPRKPMSAECGKTRSGTYI